MEVVVQLPPTFTVSCTADDRWLLLNERKARANLPGSNRPYFTKKARADAMHGPEGRLKQISSDLFRPAREGARVNRSG